MAPTWSIEELKVKAIIFGVIPFIIYGTVLWLLLVVQRIYAVQWLSTPIVWFASLGIIMPVLSGYISGRTAGAYEIRHAFATGFLSVVAWRLLLLSTWTPSTFGASVFVSAALVVMLALVGGYFALRTRRRLQIEAAGPVDETTYLNELDLKRKRLAKGCVIALLIAVSIIVISLLLSD